MPPESRWKNRFISSKFYDKDVRVSISGQKNKAKTRSDDSITESEFKLKRRRVVDLHFLANVMFCASCKIALPLEKIEREDLNELDSISTRKCHECVFFKTVLSWKTHNNRFSEPLHDLNVNTRSSKPYEVLKHSSVEKFLRTMKVPYMTAKTYVKYEKDVGPVAETEVAENCLENNAIGYSSVE